MRPFDWLRCLLKRTDALIWLGLEALAKAILARSGRYVMPGQRHRRPVHSEAWRKGNIVFVPRAFRGSAGWN